MTDFRLNRKHICRARDGATINKLEAPHILAVFLVFRILAIVFLRILQEPDTTKLAIIVKMIGIEIPSNHFIGPCVNNSDF